MTTRYIHEVMEKGEYKLLFEGLKVIDLGCNVGAFSMWIYPQCSEIHAVDLAEENINLLKKTIKDNGLDNIKTYCCAIAGENGTRMAGGNGDAPFGGWRLDEAGNVKVDAYTLKTFMDNNDIKRVDVLKIDVEGAEYEIFGAKDFPVDKISTIVGEFHGDSLKNQLEGLGYEYHEISNKFLARR